MIRLTLISIGAFLTIAGTWAQTGKEYFRTGAQFYQNKKYADAIELFNKALNADPQLYDSYIYRAGSYEQLGQYRNAAIDFDRASVFMPKDADVFFNAGRMYYKLMSFDTALLKLDKAIELKSKHLQAYQYRTLTLMELERYHEALENVKKAIHIDDIAENYYYSGMVLEKLKNLDAAEKDYLKSISKNKKFIQGYIALADVQQRLGKTEDAMARINEALKLNPNATEAYIVRSRIYVKKLDYPSAINDLSKNILLQPDNKEFYFIRGTYYQDFAQHLNAINDFNKVIQLDPVHGQAYYKRAFSYEQISNFESAVKDYEIISNLYKNDENAKQMLEKAELRLFELNREPNKPELTIETPSPKDKQIIELPKDKKQFVLKGIIKDQSKLNFFKVNDLDYEFTKTDKGYEFLANVDLAEKDMFVVTAGDAYNNILNTTFTIRRTEINTPKVAILAPYASDNGEVYLDSNDPNLYIEGKITDESLINSILIEGVSASYRLEDLNPTFTANINISNKTKFSIKVIDQYGNETNQVYTLNLENANINAENPMGKTWVVFIENSNYESFPSLDGPSKDVSLMKSALSKYYIHNFIHKKDMTKKDLERFFSIELRDLVRSNRVNSIMLWYAGHGKFINSTGYWIPTDAHRDDEFTYFNINALKASMQSYGEFVTHTLVVTDACESGPSFYQAMRSTDKPRDCNDWQATKFKSSQVFSSAGYELAVDNSQFTRTFAATLTGNPNACLPIETVVNKVTEAVARNNQQKPQFGKINGLTDEDGTFFFITK